jgi:hypothetical protein
VSAAQPPDGRAVVRRRPGTLSRVTADGFLLHTGEDVIAITGLAAELWGRVVGDVPIGQLIDLQSAPDGGGWNVVTAEDVLATLDGLQRRNVLQVLNA